MNPPQIKALTPEEIKAYYSRPEIAKRIFEMCKDREVVPVFLGGFYGTRPNSVQFPGDITHFVKNGAIAFHCSVEHWKNPQMLSNDLKRADLDKLRTGWDLVLDIDSDAGIDAARITAKLLIDEMRRNGVKNISVKFSGRRGFHLGVAGGGFPKEVNMNPISKMFPELPQKIAFYLSEKIRPELAKKLISLDPMLEEKMKEENGALNPYNVLDVEQNWSVRHLFRMPYAFNDKTWNVSLPFDASRIMEFSPEEAKPQIARADAVFLGKFEENECETLVKNALDFAIEMKPKAAVLKFKRDEKKEGLMRAIYEDGIIVSDSKHDAATQAELEEMMRSGATREIKPFFSKGIKVPEENFPPCVKKILGGLLDGRKRSVFMLINFLKVSGYSWEEIEQKLVEWNEKNPEQLSEGYWRGQLEYARTHETPEQDKLPPNCDNAGYYKDIKVCIPDGICNNIKNPVSYGIRKSMLDKYLKKTKKEKGEKAKDEKNNDGKTKEKKTKTDATGA